MKRGIAMAMLLGMMLAACDKPAAPHGNDAAVAAAAAAKPDPIEAKIAALPEPLRRATFYRAIVDAQFPCEHITKAETRGRVEGKPVWEVECGPGPEYLLTLQRGGIFLVSGVPASARR